MPDTLLAAHVTDIHYPVPSCFHLRDLMSKRITGAVNLLVSSRRSFRPHLLKSLLTHLRSIGVSHLLITGDLVNLAYPEEYLRLRTHLEESGFAPDQVSMVPGNHDAYLPEAVKQEIFWENLGPYAWAAGPRDYPVVRAVGPIEIVGISTALPTPLGMAYGEVGAEQLQRLEAILLRKTDRFRVVLIHHSPSPGVDTWHDGLVDGAQLRRLFWKYGADLILHGHEHKDLERRIDGPGGSQIPVLGTGCAILDDPRPSMRARARLFRFGDGGLERSWMIVHDSASGHWKSPSGVQIPDSPAGV